MMNPSSFDDTSVQVTSTAELPTGRADVASGVSGGCRTATQVTDHDTSAVAPRTTATVRGFVSAAVQFGASRLSATEWSPGASARNTTAPLLAMGTCAPPSTLTRYPSAWMSVPAVATETRIAPVFGFASSFAGDPDDVCSMVTSPPQAGNSAAAPKVHATAETTVMVDPATCMASSPRREETAA